MSAPGDGRAGQPVKAESSWRRASLALALVLFSLALPLYSVKVLRKTDYTDFSVDYRAAARAAQGRWDEIYTLADGASPFRYAPPTLLLFRPLAGLPLPRAQLLWFFLQYAWFGLGFVFVYRGLRLVQSRSASPLETVASRPPGGAGAKTDALWVSCLSALFVLRFCLDTFTIGQVSSLMFLGFALAFYAWIARRPALAAVGLFPPTLLKIGPGFLYGLLAGRVRALLVPLGLLSALVAASFAWLRSVGAASQLVPLWRSWARIVVSDSTYYDASHYGNQSLKGALLRLGHAMGSGAAERWASSLTAGLGAVTCALIAGMWLFRRAGSNYGRALFFALGVFPYLWFMPETFKYSLTPLAIPAALLFYSILHSRPDEARVVAAGGRVPGRRLAWAALAAGVLTLSVPGKDIVGDALFFGMQRTSLPLLATLVLGAWVAREAWRESEPTLSTFHLGEALGPWESLPAAATLEASLLLPVSLPQIAEERNDPARVLPRWLAETRAALDAGLGSAWEGFLIPYGADPTGAGLAELTRLSEAEARFQVLEPTPLSRLGRGAALRHGFLRSRGRRILTAHSEQLCQPGFYREALEALAHAGAGAGTGAAPSPLSLVRANRRHPRSRFRLPVRVLPLIYRRHRLGLAFNRLVRLALPVRTTDTQSGTYAMTRELALQAFSVQSSGDFLFDLELALTAEAQELGWADLPVELNVPREKSGEQLIGETTAIARGLPVLAWRYRLGCYGRPTRSAQVTADDWGMSAGVNEGILELARRGVVRRVSMIADGAYLRDGLDELVALGVETGLHFNLTYGRTHEKTGSPAAFLLRWLGGARRELRARVRAELEAQLALLERSGARARYLDGHQHIHLVPGLLDSVADILRARGIRQVRLPLDLSLLVTPRAPIVWLSWLARPRLRRLGFESLPCLYPQAAHFKDHGRLRAKLARGGRGAEVIVHPARINDLGALEIPDPYTEGRVLEFRALMMLAAAGPAPGEEGAG